MFSFFVVVYMTSSYMQTRYMFYIYYIPFKKQIYE